MGKAGTVAAWGLTVAQIAIALNVLGGCGKPALRVAAWRVRQGLCAEARGSRSADSHDARGLEPGIVVVVVHREHHARGQEPGVKRPVERDGQDLGPGLGEGSHV